uniref:Uncharacterized protein n=1 Tax=Ralstonia solanacearum TaxID=305 RepID=A0A0S4VHB3_RALSL|nr:protein of unknown function [Ralstonia solanacearum]CUV60287.1 protein of unknown function [Ralstonia solanacearum]
MIGDAIAFSATGFSGHGMPQAPGAKYSRCRRTPFAQPERGGLLRARSITCRFSSVTSSES